MNKGFIIALMLICTISIAKAGQETGNGSDGDFNRLGIAWFLSDKEVKFCVDINESLTSREGHFYDYSKNDLKSFVLENVQKWVDYLKSKDVFNRISGPTVATKFIYKATCEDQVDLTFMFGHELNGNLKVKRATKGMSNPQAVAHLENYDLRKGWGSGFVWIGSRASLVFDKSSLNRLILHELGHIFGMAHEAGTVMKGDVDGPDWVMFYDKIDNHKELITCLDCTSTQSGLIHPDKGIAKNLYIGLGGKKTSDDVYAELRLNTNKADGILIGEYILKSSNQKDIVLKLEVEKKYLTKTLKSKSLKRLLHLSTFELKTYSLPSYSYTLKGKLISGNKRLSVLVELNTDSTKDLCNYNVIGVEDRLLYKPKVYLVDDKQKVRIFGGCDGFRR